MPAKGEILAGKSFIRFKASSPFCQCQSGLAPGPHWGCPSFNLAPVLLLSPFPRAELAGSRGDITPIGCNAHTHLLPCEPGRSITVFAGIVTLDYPQISPFLSFGTDEPPTLHGCPATVSLAVPLPELPVPPAQKPPPSTITRAEIPLL